MKACAYKRISPRLQSRCAASGVKWFQANRLLAAVAVGAGATDIGFLLGRCRAVSTRDIGLLLCLRLDLPAIIAPRRLGRPSEGDAPHDDAVDVVATERRRPTPNPSRQGGERLAR